MPGNDKDQWSGRNSGTGTAEDDDSVEELEEIKEPEAFHVRGESRNPVFDWPNYLARTRNDVVMAKSLIRIFLGDVPIQLEKLGQAVEHRDFDTVIIYSHRIKGAAANMSATAFMHLIEAVEEAGQKARADELERLMPAVQNGFENLRTMMEACT